MLTNIIVDPPPTKKMASNRFIVLSASAGHDEFQKKSIHKSDPGKGVNLHIFKMAASLPVKPSTYY